MKGFIPYGRQNITNEDIQSVIEVLKSNLITQGPVITEFEKSVSKKVKSKYAAAVNSATSALHLTCMSLGLTKGEILWTSPNTFVASANSAKYCDAEVDFVDIDPRNGLMSIDCLNKKLKQAEIKGNLPKIVMPVHLTGASCDMKSIYFLSKKYGFFIVEDGSHAIGAHYMNSPVGDCKYSDACIFSFHPVKIITTGEGGMVTTNNEELHKKIIRNRTHGITKNQEEFVLKDFGPWSYEQQSLGYNYRITDIQAALGLSQLKRLDKIVVERNRLLNFYKSLLKDLPFSLLEIPKYSQSSVHLAVLKFNDISKEIYKKIFLELRKNNIGVQLHYSPVHLQPFYRALGFKEGDFPNAEVYSHTSLSLPLYPGLDDKDQIYVIHNLERISNKFNLLK